MSEKEKTKEIIIQYNDQKTKVNLINNYDKFMSLIKKTFYLNDKQFENIQLYYIDEDDCQNIISRESFEEAFDDESTLWQLEIISFNEQEPKIDININELNSKIKENMQTKLEKYIKEIKQNLILKYAKISKQQIEKYQQKIIYLQKQIKKMKNDFKLIIEEINDNNEKSINELKKYILKIIQDKIDTYNDSLVDHLNKEMIKTENLLNENFNDKKFEKIEQLQSKMKYILEESKTSFRDFIQKSSINISNVIEDKNNKNYLLPKCSILEVRDQTFASLDENQKNEGFIELLIQNEGKINLPKDCYIDFLSEEIKTSKDKLIDLSSIAPGQQSWKKYDFSLSSQSKGDISLRISVNSVKKGSISNRPYQAVINVNEESRVSIKGWNSSLVDSDLSINISHNN